MGREVGLFQESARRLAVPKDFVGVPNHRPATQNAFCRGCGAGGWFTWKKPLWETEEATFTVLLGYFVCFSGCRALEGSKACPAHQKVV